MTENLEWISLYLKGKHIGIATPKSLHKEAIADFKEGDKQKLDKDIANRKEYKNSINKDYKENQAYCENEDIAKMDFQTVFKDVLNDAHDNQKAKLNGVSFEDIQNTPIKSENRIIKEFSNKL